jgi:carboxylesterase type B
MAKQVRSAVAWVHKNAAKFGGDPSRLYVGGTSCSVPAGRLMIWYVADRT